MNARLYEQLSNWFSLVNFMFHLWSSAEYLCIMSPLFSSCFGIANSNSSLNHCIICDACVILHEFFISAHRLWLLDWLKACWTIMMSSILIYLTPVAPSQTILATSYKNPITSHLYGVCGRWSYTAIGKWRGSTHHQMNMFLPFQNCWLSLKPDQTMQISRAESFWNYFIPQEIFLVTKQNHQSYRSINQGWRETFGLFNLRIKQSLNHLFLIIISRNHYQIQWRLVQRIFPMEQI